MAEGIEVHAPGDAEVLSPGGAEPRRAAPPGAERQPARADRAPPRAGRGARRRRTAGVRRRERRRDRLAGGAGAARPPRPAVRDHRAGRPQDDDQRAQQRRARLHVRLRGCVLADVGERRRGPGQPPGCGAKDDRPRDAGEALRAERGDRHARGAASGLASGRAPRHRRRRAGLRDRSSTSGSPSTTTLASCWRAEAGRTSTCRSSRAGTRPACGHMRSRSRRSRSAFRTRVDPLHGSDRDDPGGIRDGRDSLRAA